MQDILPDLHSYKHKKNKRGRIATLADFWHVPRGDGVREGKEAREAREARGCGTPPTP